MHGIELKSGAIFVSDGTFTLKYNNGKWEISKIDYAVLEWELGRDNPNGYEYIFESDIKNMGEEVYGEMVALFKKIYNTLKLDCPW